MGLDAVREYTKSPMLGSNEYVRVQSMRRPKLTFPKLHSCEFEILAKIPDAKCNSLCFGFYKNKNIEM